MTLSMSDSPFVQSPPAVGEEATLDNVPSVKPEGREGGREGGGGRGRGKGRRYNRSHISPVEPHTGKMVGASILERNGSFKEFRSAPDLNVE